MSENINDLMDRILKIKNLLEKSPQVSEKPELESELDTLHTQLSSALGKQNEKLGQVLEMDPDQFVEPGRAKNVQGHHSKRKIAVTGSSPSKASKKSKNGSFSLSCLLLSGGFS